MHINKLISYYCSCAVVHVFCRSLFSFLISLAYRLSSIYYYVRSCSPFLVCIFNILLIMNIICMIIILLVKWLYVLLFYDHSLSNFYELRQFIMKDVYYNRSCINWITHSMIIYNAYECMRSKSNIIYYIIEKEVGMVYQKP